MKFEAIVLDCIVYIAVSVVNYGISNTIFVGDTTVYH